MREATEEEYEKDMEAFASADWKESPHFVLESVEEQIKEFALQIVIYNGGGDSHVWKIEQTSTELPSPELPEEINFDRHGCTSTDQMAMMALERCDRLADTLNNLTRYVKAKKDKI